MRYRAAIAFVLTVAVVVVPMALATKTAPKDFTCPLDKEAFTGRVLVSTNTFGGVDSDFCPWARGESSLTCGVQVCPKCFYARKSEDFDKAVGTLSEPKLKAAVANWRKKHPKVKTVDDLTPAQRWELAAVCAVVRHNHAPIVGNLWLRAAWAERHRGLASLNMALGDPMSSFEELDGLVMDLDEIKDAKKRVDATFKTAMLAQRVGELKRRDAFFKQLDKMKLDRVQSDRLKALKAVVAAEARYQKLALTAFKRAIDEETVKAAETHVYLFLIADTTRRLGRNAEAVKLYQQAQKAGKVRPDIRRMCAFMVNWLTDG